MAVMPAIEPGDWIVYGPRPAGVCYEVLSWEEGRYQLRALEVATRKRWREVLPDATGWAVIRKKDGTKLGIDPAVVAAARRVVL